MVEATNIGNVCQPAPAYGKPTHEKSDIEVREWIGDGKQTASHSIQRLSKHERTRSAKQRLHICHPQRIIFLGNPSNHTYPEGWKSNMLLNYHVG